MNHAKDVVFFASGSNHSGEIRALSLVPGANVGVVAEYVDRKHEAAYEELERFVETGRKVFVDSGAFAEVEFPCGVPTIVKPLGDAHWQRVFQVYRDVALTHGENAYVVAPDCVAHQERSLERLSQYAAQMRDIYDLCATVLVPLQKGALSLTEYQTKAAAILGFEFTPSIPMKKDATKPAELLAFVAEARPASIHLLGLGVDTLKAQRLFKAIREIVPACRISCDACLLMRWVGKFNGPGGGPRRYTALNDAHTDRLALDPGAAGDHEVHVRKALNFFCAAQSFWTDLGLADVPTYKDVAIPEDAQELDAGYLPLACALWGKQ